MLSCATIGVQAQTHIGKVLQCNAFIDRATQSRNVINALKMDSEDVKELERQSASIQAEANAFAALELKDEQLTGFRSAYAQSLASLGKILQDLATLQKDAQDPAKEQTVEARYKKFGAEADQASKVESDLVDRINLYCTGSK